MRQRRRLRDQRQREQYREKNIYTPQEFVMGRFFKQHKMEMALMIIMAAGITGIMFMGPDKKAIKEMSALVSSGIGDQSQRWEEAYSYGYKIIVLTDRNIIHTSYDTLPEDLRINWDDLSVSRIQSTEFGSMNEKIKIDMSGINYSPAGVSDLAVTVSFIRKKGSMVRLTNLGELEFVVEVIEDSDGRLFCLFGLRDQ